MSRFFCGEPTWQARRALAPAVLALGCFLAMPMSVLADTLTVSEWFLGCAASNPSISEYRSAFFDVVQSPFIGEHSVSLPSSPLTTSSAQYLIEYFSNYGSFHIASQQEARGLSSASVHTRAEGQIRVSTTEAIPLHIEALWSYELPADFMMTHMDVNVRAADSSEFLFIQEYQPETMPGEPSSGTLTIQGDVTLSPGHTWIMAYSLRLEADAGPNFSATGDGYVNLTITPEVSSLALLTPLLFVVSRRALRRRRAPAP